MPLGIALVMRPYVAPPSGLTGQPMGLLLILTYAS